MNHSGYSSHRVRSRSKQPVYSSDKRDKFTQRENKKWIRFVTVMGYVVFVSAPAVSLSFYYIYVWDPAYIKKFPTALNVTDSLHIHKTPILNQRTGRDLPSAEVVGSKGECSCAPPSPAPFVPSSSSPSPSPLPPSLSQSSTEAHLDHILKTNAEGSSPLVSSESDLRSSSSSEEDVRPG